MRGRGGEGRFGRGGGVDRGRRVGELIRRELARLLVREVGDVRMRMVSITEVRVSRDLKQARVYVSKVEGGEGAKGAKGAKGGKGGKEFGAAEIEGALNGASKYLRYMLGREVNLRATPALRFFYDDRIQRGVEMSARIDALVDGEDF